MAQVPAIAAHDDRATGPGRPRRPARRRDADARDQQQQPHDPLLQQLPTMEGVLAQLVEVVAAGAAGAPQEAAGGKKGGRGKGGKARVIKVGEGSYGEAWRLCCPRAGGGGGGGRGVVVKVVPIEGEEEFNGGPQVGQPSAFLLHELRIALVGQDPVRLQPVHGHPPDACQALLPSTV